MPLYVLLAPFGIGPVLYLRARRIPMYRRVFSSAALGLAGAAASAMFHWAVPQAFRINLDGSHARALLPRTDGDGACRIAERLRSSAGLLSVAADPTTDARISVTVSIGIAVLGQHGSDLFELLAAADLALYRAKDAGRNQVRPYAPRQQSAPDKESDEATGACP